ncbi:hypothetical protein BWO91_14715 [Plantibacter flavus]|uniref:LacI family DNA-binding transcriptional regulator n=1 Tax=Plantibacter flavus TaxID=150123 RepID=UPI00099D6C0E|nr:LacI family DNA-binding transcriptional regulator [Plantibacter flavus]AQX81057.1 hypothetical protein BWO91_14715 [Plantibacter flavus]
MLRSERQKSILREIDRRGAVAVTDFAARLGVSGMTVRRDLLDLEQAGLIVRVHGGAVKRHAQTHPRQSDSALTLGLIVPSATYYFPGFINGAKAAAAEQHVRLVLGVTDYDKDVERHQVSRLCQLGVDGLIVTPSGAPGAADGGDEANYHLLAQSGLPVVIMERALDDKTAALNLGGVRTDHAHGSRSAVRHLVELGRKRIALIAPPRGSTSDPVHAGYRAAIAALLPDSPHLEFDLQGTVGTTEQRRSYESIFDTCVAAGVDAMLVLPDAVAIALADRALDAGIAIPKDLSIVAYDDEIASMAAMPLTAVSPPKFDVGAIAVRTCIDLIVQKDSIGRLPPEARVLLLPTLIVRASSASTRGT